VVEVRCGNSLVDNRFYKSVGRHGIAGAVSGRRRALVPPPRALRCFRPRRRPV